VRLDGSRTQAAADARRAGARERRAALADELLELARDELARLRRPHTEHWGVGGSSPSVLSVTMPEPPPRARRDLISGAMQLVDRHAKLTAMDAASGDLSEVDRWLEWITGGEPGG